MTFHVGDHVRIRNENDWGIVVRVEELLNGNTIVRVESVAHPRGWSYLGSSLEPYRVRLTPEDYNK